MGNVHMEATQINFRGGASKMNVEEAIKSAIELTPEQKTNINKIPAIEAAVATKTDQDVIAPEFDAEAGTYAVGDLVVHEGKLYEFTTAHETAGEWDPTEVTETTVGYELSSLESGLNDVSIELGKLTVGYAPDFHTTIIGRTGSTGFTGLYLSDDGLIQLYVGGTMKWQSQLSI